jgi:flavin reductase (DIM6/NTAB) family NADH-FMN oxidoreductase RutF
MLVKPIQYAANKSMANLINAVTGIKSANLIGTISNAGEKNLAIFSSVIHLGSNPPLIGFIVRPSGEVPRHTYENIRENGFYTINHVHREFIEQAHYTSAKFDRAVSEFEACRLTEEYVGDFPAPFVKESRLKLGMQLEQELPIALKNDFDDWQRQARRSCLTKSSATKGI